MVKAWHYHRKQVDNFACLAGMIKLVLIDTRDGSPTKGAVNEFFIGTEQRLLVQIPALVYHGWKCISTEMSLVVNVPTEPYQYADPDEYRLDAARHAALRLDATRWLKCSSPAAPVSSAATSSATRSRTHPDWRVTTLDKLTYAGRRENLHDVMDDPRHAFVHGDICDAPLAGPLVERVEHRRALRRRDARRSLDHGGRRLHPTDVEGTFVLLEAARRAPALRRFVQISTDEVYGSVPEGASTETRRAAAAQSRTRRARRAPIGWPTATWRPTTCR